MSRSVFALIAVISVAACDLHLTPPDIEQEAQSDDGDVYVFNRDMERDIGWYMYRPAGTSANVSYVPGAGIDGSRAMRITGTTEQYGGAPPHMAQGLNVGDLAGRRITLKAQLKLVDVQGAGVAMFIRGDGPSGTGLTGSHTSGRLSILGSGDWAEYSVTLEALTGNVDRISCMVMLLPGTTGSVYVDNVFVSHEEARPQVGFENGGFEIGTLDYWRSAGVISGFALSRSATAFEGKHAASIARKESSTGTAQWQQTFPADAFLDGPITLRAMVRTDLTGPGAAIAIRGDDTATPTGPAEVFATSQFATPITGSSGWVERTVRLDRLPAGMKAVTVFLLFLPNTTGTVHFDAVELRK